jgi:hypothetical protein
MCFSTSIYSTKEENHDSRAQSEAGRAVVSGVWSLDTDTVSPFLLDQKRARNFKSWQPGLGRTQDYMKNSPSAWGWGSSLISTLVPVPNPVPVPDPRRSSASPCSCSTTDSLVFFFFWQMTPWWLLKWTYHHTWVPSHDGGQIFIACFLLSIIRTWR